jgi:uncharacterized protein (DUF4415 family)
METKTDRRPPGRPTLPPEDQTMPRTIRLNNARWEKLKALGRGWLERAIDHSDRFV